MKAGFIGAGKVGFTLGKYLAEGGITVTGYYSRTARSAREAAAFTGTRYYDKLADIVKDSDTLFVTVPDGAIGEVWKGICNLPIKNKNICHCSGSISSTAFFNACEKGAYRYSIHPLYAISDKYNSYKTLKNAYFAAAGLPENLQEIINCLRSLGNKVTSIDPQKKAQYHCAAVMVSNHTVALADIGAELLTECGFSRRDAELALGPLIAGNALKIAEAGPEQALTGPVERADAGTVKSHMRILSGETKEIYRLLSKRLIAVAKRKHPERDYRDAEKELEK